MPSNDRLGMTCTCSAAYDVVVVDHEWDAKYFTSASLTKTLGRQEDPLPASMLHPACPSLACMPARNMPMSGCCAAG
jgi:hypothetical protein